MVAELCAVIGATAKRSRISQAVLANIWKMLEAGKTGDEIANATKVSRATIQNIKQALEPGDERKKSAG